MGRKNNTRNCTPDTGLLEETLGRLKSLDIVHKKIMENLMSV